MDKDNPVFQEFCGYWQLSEEMIAKASKEDLAEAARILAMQAAHMTRGLSMRIVSDTHVPARKPGCQIGAWT